MDMFSFLYTIPQPTVYGLLGSVWNDLFNVFLSAEFIASLGGYYTLLIFFLSFGTLWIVFINPLRRLINWAFSSKKGSKK